MKCLPCSLSSPHMFGGHHQPRVRIVIILLQFDNIHITVVFLTELQRSSDEVQFYLSTSLPCIREGRVCEIRFFKLSQINYLWLWPEYKFANDLSPNLTFFKTASPKHPELAPTYSTLLPQVLLRLATWLPL